MNEPQAMSGEDFIQWITPKFGDPTYSLIRAHLKFEQLLNLYLDKTLPHPKELDGARLTFNQKIAVTRAICTEIPPSDWLWTALGKFNKLRNLLAHEANGEIAREIQNFIEFCADHFGKPLPDPDIQGVKEAIGKREHVFTAADMVTFALFSVLEVRLFPSSFRKT